METRKGIPTVNIKVNHFPSLPKELEESFGEKELQKCFDRFWESNCEMFWEDIPQLARGEFNDEDEHITVYFNNVKFYQEGRSGGWLIPSEKPLCLKYEEDYTDEDRANFEKSWDEFGSKVRKLIDSMFTNENYLCFVAEQYPEMLKGEIERLMDKVEFLSKLKVSIEAWEKK